MWVTGLLPQSLSAVVSETTFQMPNGQRLGRNAQHLYHKPLVAVGCWGWLRMRRRRRLADGADGAPTVLLMMLLLCQCCLVCCSHGCCAVRPSVVGATDEEMLCSSVLSDCLLQMLFWDFSTMSHWLKLTKKTKQHTHTKWRENHPGVTIWSHLHLCDKAERKLQNRCHRKNQKDTDSNP